MGLALRDYHPKNLKDFLVPVQIPPDLLAEIEGTAERGGRSRQAEILWRLQNAPVRQMSVNHEYDRGVGKTASKRLSEVLNSVLDG